MLLTNSNSITLKCPAKINLFLEITGKKQNGYHELGTLFQTLAIHDLLSATPAEDIQISCDANIVEKIEDNVIWKAARALQEKFFKGRKAVPGIRFQLKKNLPAGAGLGGGSSNAASALRLCCAIWEINPKPGELEQIAVKIGADVPFFLSGGTCFAEGIGEKLEHAPAPMAFHVLVATPNQHVSTAWAYKLITRIGENKWPSFRKNFVQQRLEKSFYPSLHNDFEEPVLGELPELKRFKTSIDEFKPVKTMLSGSGSSFFGLFENLDDARACVKQIHPQCRFVEVTNFEYE